MEPPGQAPTSQKCWSQASCPIGGQRQRTSSAESAVHRRGRPPRPFPPGPEDRRSNHPSRLSMDRPPMAQQRAR
eukprot:4962536-Alexandrium_andersonii.AAC.1